MTDQPDDADTEPDAVRPPPPLIRVDFENVDRQGRIRLNTLGTVRDLRRAGFALVEGAQLRATNGDLIVLGTVRAPGAEGFWTLEVDWIQIAEVPPAKT